MMKLLAACLCIAWVGDMKEHTLKQEVSGTQEWRRDNPAPGTSMESF